MSKSREWTKYFLIVDDLPHQCEVIEMAIAIVAPDSKFAHAHSLAEAKTVIEDVTEPIHLAVVDLVLKREEKNNRDGIEVIRMLKTQKHRQGVPAILITAHPDGESKTLAETAGADTYISKLDDATAPTLRSTVKKLLGL